MAWQERIPPKFKHLEPTHFFHGKGTKIIVGEGEVHVHGKVGNREVQVKLSDGLSEVSDVTPKGVQLNEQESQVLRRKSLAFAAVELRRASDDKFVRAVEDRADLVRKLAGFASAAEKQGLKSLSAQD